MHSVVEVVVVLHCSLSHSVDVVVVVRQSSLSQVCLSVVVVHPSSARLASSHGRYWTAAVGCPAAAADGACAVAAHSNAPPAKMAPTPASATAAQRLRRLVLVVR